MISFIGLIEQERIQRGSSRSYVTAIECEIITEMPL